MEYNLEADQKSNRSEWCTLFYHGNYYPNKCAYSVELNWMVATCSIIADLVNDVFIHLLLWEMFRMIICMLYPLPPHPLDPGNQPVGLSNISFYEMFTCKHFCSQLPGVFRKGMSMCFVLRPGDPVQK